MSPAPKTATPSPRDPEAVAAEIARIRDGLLSRGNARHLVCDERCRFVVEGYPRSANTLSADLLAILAPNVRFGHHTHSALNLRLAELYRIPRVVLLRRPEDAILSHFIYADGRLSIDVCADRYVEFYRDVAKTRDFIVAEFTTVVEDFNAVVAALNQRLDEPIPFSDDLGRDVDLARERQIERARRVHGALATQRVGTPDEARETLKNESREAVRERLARNDEPEAIYHTILSRA